MLNDETENKIIKKPDLTRVNLSNPCFESWHHDNPLEVKLKQFWSLILNQLSVKDKMKKNG
jgi:hypothetical protein